MVCEGREHPESSLRVEMLQQVLEEDQASASDKGAWPILANENPRLKMYSYLSLFTIGIVCMYVYIYIYILYIYIYIYISGVCKLYWT